MSIQELEKQEAELYIEVERLDNLLKLATAKWCVPYTEIKRLKLREKILAELEAEAGRSAN